MTEENCEEIRIFLKQFGLLEYEEALCESGLENLQIINELEDEDIDEIIKDSEIKACDVETFQKAIASVKNGTYNANEKAEEEVQYEYKPIEKCDQPKEEKEENKTILFIGESGVGKTTTINSMCNYLYNVNYNDKFRYKLIYENEKKENSTQSQTQKITPYYLNNFQNENINYSLTIIDTPGFGNTESIKNDEKLQNDLKECFEKYKFINAIYFVVKATETRLSDTQKYTFNMIYSLFYNIDNIKNNMFIMFTFSDGSDPPAIQSIKKLQFEHHDDNYFKINNSGFTLPANNNHNTYVHKMYYNSGLKQFDLIFNELKKTKQLSTKPIVENIEEVMREKNKEKDSTEIDDNDSDDDEKLNCEDSRKIRITELIEIKFDKNKYLVLRDTEKQFILYNAVISIKTKKQISFDLYLTVKEIALFHQRKIRDNNHKLREKKNHPEFIKFNPSTIEPINRNKVVERIDKLNKYVQELIEYMTNSSEALQESFLKFFQINAYNSIYKYICHDNVEILKALHEYNKKFLVEFIDNNKSNVFHYIISQNATNVLKWILNLINNKELKKQLLNAKDQYKISPITLAKYPNYYNKNIYNLVQKYAYDEQKEEKEEKINVLPYQYKSNSKKKKRKLWIVVRALKYVQKIWDGLVQKFLEYNKDLIDYEIYECEPENKFQALMKQLQCNECNKCDIVCIGGDTLISKILNGLYNNNYNKNIHVCITPIPSKSCNALAKELKMNTPVKALSKLLDGFETCIHSYVVSQENKANIYAFASAQWATLAKTGTMSPWTERWEMAKNVGYKARVYFKPINKNNINININTSTKYIQNLPALITKITNEKNYKIEGDWKCIEGEFQLLCVTNLQWIAQRTNMGGKGFSGQVNALRLVYNKKDNNFFAKMRLSKALNGLKKGEHLDLEFVGHDDVEEVVIEALAKDPHMYVDQSPQLSKPMYIKLLPSELDFVVTC